METLPLTVTNVLVRGSERILTLSQLGNHEPITATVRVPEVCELSYGDEPLVTRQGIYTTLASRVCAGCPALNLTCGVGSSLN